MTPNTIPAHSDIDPKYTWNAPSVFPTVEAWEAECASVAADLAGLQQYQGHLADGPAVLADAMTAIQSLVGRALKLYTYAGMSYAVDTNDAAAAKRNGRVQGLWGQVMAAIAFLDPELLAIGEATLRKWLAEDAPAGVSGATTSTTCSASRRTSARPRWRSCWASSPRPPPTSRRLSAC